MSVLLKGEVTNSKNLPMVSPRKPLTLDPPSRPAIVSPIGISHHL
jgi:hypothetical protein